MSIALLANAVAWGMSAAELAITVIVVAAVIAIAYAFLTYSGVQVPPVVLRVFWIVVAAVVCILAIKLLMAA